MSPPARLVAVPGAADPGAGTALIAGLLRRCTFPERGTAVVCGVSGGPDSLALLVLAREAGLEVTAVHVDHGLRPGSHDEAALVEAACRSVGATFRSVRVDVGRGANLEARARAARHGALGPGALLGHTMDDQAVTVLLNLLRGSGLDGLAGMRPDRHPILGLRRLETVAVCRAVGLVPFADPSNLDPRHRRNDVRDNVVPVLDRIIGGEVAPVLARQALVLRDEATLLDELASAIDPTDTAALRGAPVALARRALRRWLADPYPPGLDDIERVLAVARGERTGCEISGGRRIRRRAGRLRVDQPSGSLDA